MADYMMEAIADFSKNKNTNISLVRVVIFQAEMVPIYLEQMEKASKPDSTIMGMVTAPLKNIGKAIRGMFASYFNTLKIRFYCDQIVKIIKCIIVIETKGTC